MRPTTTALFGILLVCLFLNVLACERDQKQNGCKVYGGTCVCGYGCRTEFIYKSKAACLDVLKDGNACQRLPCQRGICIQTTVEPGFTCKCEGTGFYGRFCERACPTLPMPGLVFPHECIVI